MVLNVKRCSGSSGGGKQKAHGLDGHVLQKEFNIDFFMSARYEYSMGIAQITA